MPRFNFLGVSRGIDISTFHFVILVTAWGVVVLQLAMTKPASNLEAPASCMLSIRDRHREVPSHPDAIAPF
jgi:hypothetical protein